MTLISVISKSGLAFLKLLSVTIPASPPVSVTELKFIDFSEAEIIGAESLSPNDNM